jgi:hypothetical protein
MVESVGIGEISLNKHWGKSGRVATGTEDVRQPSFADGIRSTKPERRRSTISVGRYDGFKTLWAEFLLSDQFP